MMNEQVVPLLWRPLPTHPRAPGGGQNGNRYIQGSRIVDTKRSPEQEATPSYGVLYFEKRRCPRYTVLLPIEFHRIGSSAGTSSQVLDVSEGGLLLDLSEQMEIGQHLRVRLFLSMGPKPDIIELVSEVVWVQAHIGGRRWMYRTGVKLADISPGHLTHLKAFLITLSQP
jgi:hypothetical protein